MRISALLAVSSVLLLAVPIGAEVSAVLESGGSFVDLNVQRGPRGDAIWAKVSSLPDAQVLNPQGDRIGDLVPTCGIIWMPMDDPTQIAVPGQPPGASGKSALVVWARHDGHDYELVYSLWDGRLRAWRAAGFVDRANNGFDDVEPLLVVRDRRIYVSWETTNLMVPQMFVRGTLVATGGSPDVVWETPAPLRVGQLVDGLDLGSMRGDSGAPEQP
jgi:hypothetical protein